MSTKKISVSAISLDKAHSNILAQREIAREREIVQSGFMSGLSYKIRTPMNVILGFGDLLKQRAISEDEKKVYSVIMEKGCTHLLNIITDMNDLSNLEAGQMGTYISECNLNEKLECIYYSFKSEVENKGMFMFLHRGLPDVEAMIRTDREKISIIINHLLKNAIKFSNKGDIDFGYVLKHKHLEFFVSDTGIGIPKEKMHDIFDRYIQIDNQETDMQQGAGLGLAIAKKIVELLGGKIWVESEIGKGSTFFFKLPYHKIGDAQMTTINEFHDIESQEYSGNLKTLIVEDDSLSELLIKLAVLARSCEVMIARNGLEAVEICRNNPDLDLILMDIQLTGIDGYKATREIRSFNKEVVIIAETAFALKGDRERAMEAGCNEYIAKPFTKVQLLEVIDRVISHDFLPTDKH